MIELCVGILTLLGAGCGWVSTGASTGTDAVPTASTIIAQGNLTGLNAVTASGAVVVYRVTDTNQLIIRLEGLSLSISESALQLSATLNSGSTYTATLSVYTGNKNYSTTQYSPTTITRVELTSPTRAVPREIASANLIATD